MANVDPGSRQAVVDVLHRWCELIDRKDFDKLDEVYVADFNFAATYPDGSTNSISGLADLIGLLHLHVGADSYCGPTQHNVLNVRVSADESGVTSTANFYAVHLGQGPYDGQLYSMWGTYGDNWVETADGWRIKLRRYRVAITQGPDCTVGK